MALGHGPLVPRGHGALVSWGLGSQGLVSWDHGVTGHLGHGNLEVMGTWGSQGHLGQGALVSQDPWDHG